VPGRSVLVQQCKSEECEAGERRRGSLGEGEEAGTKDDEGTEMRPADEGLTGRRGRGYNWPCRGSKDSSAKWRRRGA
jgi:hypothetical protein